MFDNFDNFQQSWRFLTIFDSFDKFLQYWPFLHFWTILTMLTYFENYENFWQLTTMLTTQTITFAIFTIEKTILENCDIWDTEYNSDNREPEFMTIFVTWQLIVTLDSIRNSCDVFFLFCQVYLFRLFWWQDQSGCSVQLLSGSFPEPFSWCCSLCWNVDQPCSRMQ